MLLSTREATSIEVLTPPAALDLMGFPRRFFCARRLPLRWASLAFPLASQHLVKQFQPFFDVQRCGTLASVRSGNGSDRVACSSPVQFITWADAVPIGKGLGDRNLKLAGNLTHGLTIARIKSLINATRLDSYIGPGLHPTSTKATGLTLLDLP